MVMLGGFTSWDPTVPLLRILTASTTLLSVNVRLTDAVADGVRARDPDAIATCYEVLADALFRYLLGLGGRPDQAEDLVEATFVELIEYGPRLRGGADAVRAWMFRAARNNLLDARRKELRRGDVPLTEPTAAVQQDPGPGPEELAWTGARAELVRQALTQLSDDQREVLSLRFGAGMTGPEVAAMTGKSVTAVKALQHRGLAALGRVLGADPDAPYPSDPPAR